MTRPDEMMPPAMGLQVRDGRISLRRYRPSRLDRFDEQIRDLAACGHSDADIAARITAQGLKVTGHGVWSWRDRRDVPSVRGPGRPSWLRSAQLECTHDHHDDITA